MLASVGVGLLPLFGLVAMFGGGGGVGPAPVLASSNSNGYLLVAKDGGVFNFGDAHMYGSAAGVPLSYALRGIAARPAHDGYWLVAADGGIFAYGAAPFLGSTGNITLARPVWGMAPTPTGAGYWLVATDGGVFSFGDAQFFGSTGAMRLNKPIEGIAATPSGRGYWLVAADGGIFSFGDAAFFGSTGAITLRSPIASIAATPSGQGYWLVAQDGGVFAFGDAGYYGSAASLPLTSRIVGIAPTSSGQGYWLAAADGGVFAYGDAAAFGSAATLHLASPVIGIAATGVLNEAPTAALTGSSTVVTNHETVTVTGSASDDDGLVRSVEASVDGGAFTAAGVSCVSCDTAAALWSFTGLLAEGTHHIAVRAIDDNGAASTARTVTVVVDQTAPTVAITGGPANGGYSTTASPTFSGMAADGATGVAKVTVAVDGGAATDAACPACRAGNVSWSFTPAHGLADGAHTFVVRSVDAAGSTSASTSRTITVDTHAPAAPMVGPFALVNNANRTAVSLSGTAEANSRVGVSVTDSGSGVVTDSVVADGSGNWTSHSLDLTPLADGGVTVSASATDAAGNTGAAGTQAGVKDATPPAAPAVNAFAVNNSNKTAVSLSGTAEANSTVNLSVTGTGAGPVTDSVVADGSGNWTSHGLNLSAFADASVTASATATDGAGNTGGAGSRVGVKDVVVPAAPTVSAYAPVNNAGQSAAHFSGTAEANSTVSLSVTDSGSGVVHDSVTANGSGNWTSEALDLSALADGAITVSATATDAAGNTGAAGSRAGVKETVAPVAPVVNAFAAVNGVGQSAVSFVGTAEANSAVSLTVTDSGSGVVHDLVAANGSGVWTSHVLDLSSLADGAITVSATATDAAGNTGAAGTRVGVKDTVAPVAPVVSAFAPVNGSNRAAATFSGTAEALSTVSLSVTDAGSGVVHDSVTADGSGNWTSHSLNLTALADGAVTVSAAATDAAGNTGGAGSRAGAKDTVAPGAPTVAVYAAVNGATKAAAVFSGTAEAGSTATLSVTDSGTGVVHDSVTADGSGNWTSHGLDLSGLADGAITVSATATDGAGNTGGAGSRSGAKDTGAPGAPGVSVFAPVNSATKTATTFSGTAEANATVTLSVTDTGSGVVHDSVTASGLGNWTSHSLNLSALADGVVTVSATATDSAGNTGGAGSRAGVKDTVAPGAPAVSVFAAVNSSTKAAVVFSGTAEANSTVSLSVTDSGSGHVTDSVLADPSGIWTSSSLNLAALADGSITVSATAMDAAGNTGAAGSRAGVKDTVAPAAPVVTAFAAVNGSTQGAAVFSGTAEANATVTLSVTDSGSGVVHDSVTANQSGNWISNTLDLTGLADGPITVSATARDAAGNSGAAGSRVGVKDTVAPTLMSFDSTNLDTTVTLHLSEAVVCSGLDSSLFAVTVDGVADVMAVNCVGGSNSTLTGTLAVPPLGIGSPVDISIGVGALTDVAGNSSALITASGTAG